MWAVMIPNLVYSSMMRLRVIILLISSYWGRSKGGRTLRDFIAFSRTHAEEKVEREIAHLFGGHSTS